ncbi:unnamed protein product [Parascedosporium putredinis]|uniref:VHS domain-containing protein n=1 Tax=Parascedosporium putredinis TaxID=1442378 RepID=A0A9P1HCH2_9PEZI|nr:unnamed protein product [Parascedosporium putredinis]CAI8004716.1 unnamed protein product [Parascedosporium putredinis]
MMYSKTLVALVALVASVAAVPGCVPKPKYEPCGGLTPVSPRDTGCNEGFTCVSDPRKPGCGLACDEPGICVPDDVAICGGIGGFTCETGLVCFDKPDDNCDPSEGADCLGICLHPLRTARSRGGSKRRLESATPKKAVSAALQPNGQARFTRPRLFTTTSGPKPYTAVTVSIENLTSEIYEEEDLSGIPELVEVIMLQASGPTEAARAIRKKLKYGNVHRQIRALVLLDGLIQNAGSRFQRCFCDEALLERLRVCGTSGTSHPEQLPKRKAAVTQERSKVVRRPRILLITTKRRSRSFLVRSGSFFGSSSKDKKKKDKDKKSKSRKPFNLEAEKDQMKATIAESSISATNLMNALKSINRETERISDNQSAIHHVESEQYLGSLLHANDELILALMTFEQLDRSIDADSDSEDELAEQAHLYRMAQLRGRESNPASPTSPTPDVAGLSISSSSPPRPAPPRPSANTKPTVPAVPQRPRYTTDDESEEEDENDPFADRNESVNF